MTPLTATTRCPADAATDRGLVLRAQDGDRGAFAELYRRHAPAVARLAWARGPIVEAEDAVAETFARAWRSLPRYRDTGVPFVAWLYGIARNVIADGHRKRWRVTPTEEAPEAVQPDGADGVAELIDLGAALAGLNRRHRRVLELKYLAGLTNDQVGAALGISPGAVNTLQWRAVQRLRSIMEATS